MAGSKRRQRLEQELRRRRKLAARRAQNPAACDIADHAARLISQREWDQARQILEAYDEDRPGDFKVLRLLLDVYHEQHEYGLYCRVCQRLLKDFPANGPLYLMLASGFLADLRPASALNAFRTFVERWPDDPLADGARESIAEIEPVVEELLQDVPFPPAERLELAAVHEEVIASLAAGQYDRVVQLAEQLRARCPEFLPVVNNLSQAYFLTGRTEEALAASRWVLDRDPGSFHALANLARHLLFLGRHDEAHDTARRLQAAQSDKLDIWSKKAEAFSFLGDDQGVLEAFAGAKQSGYTDETTPDVALLFHLTAVAAARQGDHRQARKHWQRALEIAPGFELALENLADAKLPIGERHGPWPYSINYWVSETTIAELAAAFDPPASRRDDRATQRTALAFDRKHPEIANLVPLLLDRGDQAGREFAWRYAALLGTPAMLEALRVFCLSQRGPDSLRLETANRLCREGTLPAGRVRMWLRGEWQDAEMMGFEITGEPTGPGHSPEVEEWAYGGMQALHCGDGQTGERLFRKCIDAEGERPEFLNNLAAAYDLQGNRNEAHRLLHEIHERWPDYFFGRIAMANLAAQEGKYDKAEAYLAPLRQQRRLHTSEFAALATATIQLYLDQRNFDAARSWLEMFKGVVPDHPEIARLERAIDLGGTLGKAFDRLAGLFTRGRKRAPRRKTE
jgi:tetratricopeptide (TPR) repeat protein